MSAILGDTFVGTGPTALVGRTPTGPNASSVSWQGPYGSGGSDPAAVMNDRLIEQAAGGNGILTTYLLTGKTLPNAQYAEIGFDYVDSTASIGIVIRAAVPFSGGSTVNCRLYLSGAQWKIDVSSGYFTVASYNISAPSSTGNVLRIEGNGTSYKTYYNGSLLGTATDSTVSGGAAGIYIPNAYTTTASNRGLPATYFEAGDIVATLSATTSKGMPLAGTAQATVLAQAASSQPLPLGGSVAAQVGALPGRSATSSKAVPLSGSSQATVASLPARSAASSLPLPLSGTATADAGSLPSRLADSSKAVPLGGSAAATLGVSPVPTHMTVDQQPSDTTIAGIQHTQQPIVTLRDAGENAVQGNSAVVTAALQIQSGSGTAIGTLTKAAVNGVANFSGNGLGVNTTELSVVRWAFSTPGLPTVYSQWVTITPAYAPPPPESGVLQYLTFFTDDTHTVDGSVVDGIPTVAQTTCATDPGHIRPFMMMVLEGVDKRVDLVEASVAIGSLTLRVQDTRRTANQDTGWFTQLLADAGGKSALIGQRVSFKQIDQFGTTIDVDLLVHDIDLEDTLTSYKITTRDIRERERTLPLFYRSEEAVVWPIYDKEKNGIHGIGTRDGYGRLNPADPNSPQLIPPSKGVIGVFKKQFASSNFAVPRGTTVTTDLDIPWGGIAITAGKDQVTLESADALNEQLTQYFSRGLIPDQLKSIVTPAGGFITAEVADGITLQWRPAGSTGAWTTIRYMPAWQYAGTAQFVIAPGPNIRWSSVYQGGSGQPKVLGFFITAKTWAELPADGQSVEFRLLSGLPPSDKNPIFYEGTFGALLKKCYDGDYTAYDPGIRYNQARMDWLVANTPICRMIKTESEKDGQQWLQEHWYKVMRMIPLINEAGEIVPTSYELPDASAPLVTLDINNTDPASVKWKHESGDAVSGIEFTYHRDYVDADGNFGSIEVHADRMDADSNVRIGDKPAKFTPDTVRDVTGNIDQSYGQAPATNEIGYSLSQRIGHSLIDRLSLGGQHVTAGCLRSDADVRALKEGDWVIAAFSWLPEYQTQQRGMNRLMQVVGVKDKDPVLRDLELIDAGPYAQPVVTPLASDGSVALDVSQLVVTVNNVPASVNLRVDVAQGATAPSEFDPAWVTLGRKLGPGTVTIRSRELAAGLTWVRIRQEKNGVRPSSWVSLGSITVPNAYAVLASQVLNSDGTVRIIWNPIPAVAGIRIYYASYPDGGSEPSPLTTYVDVDGSLGAVDLPLTLDDLDTAVAEIQGFSGWTGSAVSGTAGISRRLPDLQKQPTLTGGGGGTDVYNQINIEIIDVDDTTVTVQVTATATTGVPTVQLVGINGAATVLSGPAVGVPSPSGTQWVFNRAPDGQFESQAEFQADAVGNVTDHDFVTIAPQVAVVKFVECRTTLISSTATTVTVQVDAVSDAGSPTVKFIGVTGSATKSSGPNVGVVSPSGTQWTFTKGAALGGDGQAQFRAELAGYQSDDDFIVIPAQGRDTVAVQLRARVVSVTPTTITVRVALADPYPQGAASGTITYQNNNTGGVSPASGGTVTPAATLSEAAGTYIDYVITRPTFGTGAGRVTFTGSAAGRLADSDAIDVPEANRDTVYLASRARVIASDATTVTVRYAVADPYPQGAGSATITYQAQGTGTVTPTSGQTVTPAATLTEGAGTYVDFVIARAPNGAGTGRVTFTATAANRVSDSDAVDVPEQSAAPGAATVTQPKAWIEQTSEDLAAGTVTFTLMAALGLNASSPLEYQIRTGTGAAVAWPGTWTTYPGTPPTVIITKNAIQPVHLQLRVRQGDGQITTTSDVLVPGKFPGMDVGGHIVRSQPWDDGRLAVPANPTDTGGFLIDDNVKEPGGARINRIFLKGLSADPNTTDGIPNTGTVYRMPVASALNGSNQVDFGGAGVVNRVAANILRIGGGASVQAIISQLTDAGHAGSGMQESGNRPINRLLAKSLSSDPDTTDGVPNTGLTYRMPVKGALNGSNEIDFSSSSVVNRTAGNLLRAPGGAAVNLILAQLTDTGHAASGMQESNGRPINRLFAKSVSGSPDNVDNTPDGLTYGRIKFDSIDANNIPYYMSVIDTRSTVHTPAYYSKNVRGLFKDASVVGIPGAVAGQYAQVLGWRGWTDDSGGGAGELAVAPNGTLWYRSGTTASGWSGWGQLLTTTMGLATFTGSRPVGFDPANGIVSVKGDAGGWAMGFFFTGSGNTSLGGFGANGSGNTLNYYFIGTYGSAQAFIFYPNGNLNIYGTLTANVSLAAKNIILAGNANPYVQFSDGTYTAYWQMTGGSMNLYHNGASRLEISPTGTFTVRATLSMTADIVTNAYNVVINSGVIGYDLETFNPGGTINNTIPHYGLRWLNTTYSSSFGPALVGGAYGGISLFVAGSERLRIHPTTGIQFYNTVNGSRYQFGSGPYFEYIDANNVGFHGAGSTSNLVWYTPDGVLRGYVYADTSGFGLLGSPGNWALRVIYGSADISAPGSITAYDFILSSDRRLKKHVKPLRKEGSALAKIRQLTGYLYKLKGDKGSRRRLGVMHDEVEQVVPEAVYHDEQGMGSVSYLALIPLLIEGLKELEEELCHGLS